ncbi:uncharacterized protein RHOBADRAFT_41001 [Rhodotorula graminis WP1]|uniref:Chalcone isomerase domain-containing protein n=1 Tax=Rhodotorula graminis (strain WP1) TaxID=578459 RepID=A0A194SDD9_RHOGW|nr:uncharacterized protein RHOBADRAFT_41001 [Rhodotorula graminis WP1]KPV78455.1 hypothetical protein RHOBADRAFT_41001 [Rhodotorula graminis WP1]
MLSRPAIRATSLARAAASRPSSSSSSSTSPRSIATRARLPRNPHSPNWGLVGAAAAATGLAAAAYHLKPEWLPTPAPLHADAPPPVGVHLDPTTKTPFPTRLTSPDGTQLRLVGTGVRTVSFLAVKVYAVAFYVSERELDLARQGKLAGWNAYTPERLIPPFKVSAVDATAPNRLVGEELVETLLEKADAAVVIIPLRNTSLPHLRDGFSRALVARMKVPRVSNEFTDTMNEATGAAMVDFKSFFPSRTVQKGMPLELYYSAKDRSVTFQLRDENTHRPEVLGTLREPTLATQLMASYFSNDNAPSPELVKSVAMGMDPASDRVQQQPQQ